MTANNAQIIMVLNQEGHLAARLSKHNSGGSRKAQVLGVVVRPRPILQLVGDLPVIFQASRARVRIRQDYSFVPNAQTVKLNVLDPIQYHSLL